MFGGLFFAQAVPQSKNTEQTSTWQGDLVIGGGGYHKNEGLTTGIVARKREKNYTTAKMGYTKTRKNCLQKLLQHRGIELTRCNCWWLQQLDNLVVLQQVTEQQLHSYTSRGVVVCCNMLVSMSQNINRVLHAYTGGICSRSNPLSFFFFFFK